MISIIRIIQINLPEYSKKAYFDKIRTSREVKLHYPRWWRHNGPFSGRYERETIEK